MGELHDVVVQYLREQELNFSADDDGTVWVPFGLEQGTVYLRFWCKEEQSLLLCHSTCPVNAPADRRDAIAELLTRANYGMWVGNFETDLADGEIRYKTSVGLKGCVPVPAVVGNLLGPNLGTMERYLPAIIAVAFRDADPVTALAAVED